ncbi:hypothetical protein CTI12_AA275430 [Artemisia annua]|uniref:Retrotransposon gag domain-containing protein n=1 Tax=Artemisia annua TaxID=35608 RepID=A0A2U1NF27_ARTAN|nr:hypothetical protein CTI12_AA275430 [Artemisia annua]
MVGRRRRGLNVEGTPVRERDIRDIEIDDLRRQVQQLQEQLQRLQPQDEHHSRRSSQSNNEDSNNVEENPFFHSSSSEEVEDYNYQNRGRRNQFREFDIKVNIPEFEGRMQPDEFLDWLHTVERVFDFKEVSDERKVKLVALKLRKYASLWWENLKRQRARDGKRPLRSWEKLKRELKKRFLPESYRQDSFLKLHNLKQNELSCEDYTAEFDHLMIKCDIVEPEEQTIARYLGGLRPEISNVVQLQPYWTYSDVCKLAVKVEKQQKEARNSRKDGSFNQGRFSASKPFATVKPSISKHQTKAESSTVSKSQGTSNTKFYFQAKVERKLDITRLVGVFLSMVKVPEVPLFTKIPHLNTILSSRLK